MTADRPRNFVRSLDEPDELIELETVRSAQVNIAGLTVAYDTQAPGWRWSTHVGAPMGATHCKVAHIGLVVEGHATVAMHDGVIHHLTPGSLFSVPAEPHDSWVVGDAPYVSLHFLGAAVYATSRRVLRKAELPQYPIPIDFIR